MNKYLDDWMKELDDLEVQLDLDEGEIAENFEATKSKFHNWIEDVKGKLDSLEAEGQNLRGKLDHLRVQLALGKADSRDAFEEQKSKIEHAVEDVSNNFRTWEQKAEDTVGTHLTDLSEDFKAKLDVLRLQYHLGKADAADELNEKRSELKSKLAELKVKAKQEMDEADDKFDAFSEEVSEAYTHIKKALKGLFS